MSTVIDGCCADEAIADRFASVFQSVCIPNSDVRHRELCDDFERLFRVYDETCNETITVEQIEVACKSLKRGKASGLDCLTVERDVFSSCFICALKAVIQHVVVTWFVS